MSLFTRRRAIPPDDVDMLLRHFLEPDAAFAEKFRGLVGHNEDAFQSKDITYQLALVMVCIVSREKRDNRFTAVRSRFEAKVILPLLASDESFQPQYLAAMREIANLESSGTTHLSWARDWFAGIGVQITNPVDLTLFVTMWKQRLFHTLKLLIDIGKTY